jgi:hypothetical protein
LEECLICSSSLPICGSVYRARSRAAAVLWWSQVKLAYHPATKRKFAMKVLQKAQIVHLRQQSNIMNERNLMMRIDHPFILKLYDTYRDSERLYMLLELVQVRTRAAM